jgi:hypothetical protein
MEPDINYFNERKEKAKQIWVKISMGVDKAARIDGAIC